MAVMGDGVGSTSVRGGLLGVDKDGRVKWATRGARALLGVDASGLIGRPWAETFPPADGSHESPAELLALCRARGEAAHDGVRMPGARNLRSFLEEEDDGIVEHLAPMPMRDAFDEAITALDHAERLQALSAALSEASTLSDAVDAFVTHALPALGGQTGAVIQRSRDRTHLNFVEGHLATIRVPAPFRSIPLDAPSALVKAWLGQRTLWISDVEMYEALFGQKPVELQELGLSTVAFVPMLIGNEIVGMLVFDFEAHTVLDDTRRRFAEVVAQACAHAFERARLTEEERKTLKALADKEKRLRLALQTGQMLTWEYDVESGMLWTNDNAAEVGLESTGPRTIDDFTASIHPDERTELRRQFMLALDTQTEFESTFRRRFADGSWRWLASRGVCTYDKDGKLQGLLGVSRDVNDEKRAEIALRTSENMLRTVGQTQPVLVWTNKPTGEPDFLNAQFLKYTGYEFTPGQPIELNEFGKFFHPDDVERVREQREKSLRTQGIWEVEFRFRRHDGVYRWFLGRVVPVRDETGEIHLWVGSATDIDDQKKVLAEREALLVKTQEAVQGREVFLAVAAHELRTPMTPLRLRIDTLLKSARSGEELNPDRVLRGLEVASRQIQRLQLLVEALLDVSRIASGGQIELRPEHVDLVHIAHDVAERHRPELKDADISVVAETPIDAWMDRMRVEQVLTNLVTNAIKYGNGSPVCVALSATKEHAKISVSDSGLGIPESDQERIFERFERAGADLPHGGLGLGLWIVRQIVQTLGGDIRVESEPGEGSTFTVEFPLGAAPAH